MTYAASFRMMTWAEAELAFRGRGPPPVPRRISLVLAVWASVLCERKSAPNKVTAPARNTRRLPRGIVRIGILRSRARHLTSGGRTICEVSTSKMASLLGTPLPVIQAPMAGVQGSVLAIAVSNAGGLGSLPGAMLTPEGLRDEIANIATHTSNAYNVNLFCHTPPKPDADREARWRDLLAPYYRELDISPQAIQSGPGRAPFDHNTADVLAQFKPPVVSFHFGLPSKELLDRVKQWRPTIISSATTVDEARWLEAQGVGAIIAQGIEAGGHRGMFLSDDLTTQVGTFALVPQIVHAVDRKSTRLNSSHLVISYAVFCLTKKNSRFY